MNFLKHFLILFLFILSFGSSANAQRDLINMPDHDDKPYYFGLTFGLNFARYHASMDKSFTYTDTFKYLTTRFSPGFNLGLMGNLRLSKLIDLRFTPTLTFAGKRVQYNAANQPDKEEDKIVESILMHMPLGLKIKSDRIKNFRFYALVGGKLDYDMAANARSRRRDEFLKVKPMDLGGELGVGFEWYYPNFIFSPEIKMSQGFMNQVYKNDKGVPLSNSIDKLTTRMIVISIHLEG